MSIERTMKIIDRQIPKTQEPKVRARNFDEVSLGYDYETALIEAERCLHCKDARCVAGCPVGVNIPAFISKLHEGDILGAGEIIKLNNSLPAVCGRVCPQETQCEAKCVRGMSDKLGGAVAIGALERFVADYCLEHAQPLLRAPYNGKKVAVIGSGPAGLTCAGMLAKFGCKVTVYEAFHKAGGVLVYGIPEFRLPKVLVEREIDTLRELGVDIVLNTVIGKTIMIEELLEEYDAIFIGTGAGLPMFMNIPGESLNGVYTANEYLTRVNLMKAYDKSSDTPIVVGKNVVVVGAGNVAMDAARTAIRLGAESVKVVYRRSRAEMPARYEEIEHAEEEGIELVLLTNPIEIVGEGKVEGVRCVKMALGEPDKSGRRRPVAIEGSEFFIEADQVIMSLGTTPNPLLKKSTDKLATTLKGTIVVNEETLESSIKNVYAGGDVVTGAATVILAMSAGKKAANSILERLNVR